MDAREVKQRLINNLEAFLSYLLPNGKRHGHEFRVGDISGSPGKSLAVNLQGEASGVWQDFATGEKGDIYDLYCAVRGIGFSEAFPQICSWLGVSEIKPAVKKVKPPKPDITGIGKGSPRVLKYLTEVRGLSPETLKTYNVRSHIRQSQFNQDFVAFNYIDSEGANVMLKSTGIEKKQDGTKDIWTTPPYYTLWGWWLVKSSDRKIVITEGEFDACSVHQLEPGMPVLSMPSGASNLNWIDNDWIALQRFETIYICTDKDDAGERAAQEIAKRLGLSRCIRIKSPWGKDANETLLNGEPEHLEFSSWIAVGYSYDPPTLRGASSFLEDAKRRLNRWQEADQEKSFVLPSVDFAFRDGECTLVIGVTGHGKSELTYQSFLHEMKNGHKCCFASMEIDPDEMLLNLSTQLLGHEPKASELDKTVPWFDGKLWFYSPKESIKNRWKTMFDDFTYASQRFGVDRFAIDSLMFCVPKDDYNAQDEFCVAVRDFNRVTDTHCIVIAHASTKKKEDVPGLGDILGSSGIPAPFSNVLIVWRNVEKEDKVEVCLSAGDTAGAEKLAKEKDALLFIPKNRRKGKRSKTNLWFDSKSRTFRTTHDLPPPPNTGDLF